MSQLAPFISKNAPNVFYNYILKCFVISDLKIGKLTHQDIGQMQMYVNYYTREMMNEGDSHPICIILCADKSDSVEKRTGKRAGIAGN